MRSCNGGTPAIATPSNLLINLLFHQLQLGSDIQECLTRTGLTPSPARCNFRVFPTVFVIVFHSFYKFHSVNYTEKSRFRQGLDKDICCFPRQIFLLYPLHFYFQNLYARIILINGRKNTGYLVGHKNIRRNKR